MIEKFINPFTDFGFKKLFGEDQNKELLIDFLNQLLPPKDQIKDLTFHQNEHYSRSSEDRRAIFDLYCENQDGEKFIIELQRARQSNFKERSLYYASFPIQEQAKSGMDWKFDLKGVYTIGIMDFIFEEHKDKPNKILHHVQLMETELKEVYYDKLTFIYLETPKFVKQAHELETRFDKWLYLLRNLNRLTDRPVELQERIFQRFFDLAEIAKYDPQQLHEYRESLKQLRDYYNTLDTSKQEGIEIGIEIGRKKGIEEGIKAGKIQSAKTLISFGISIEKIAESTGLSVEEIKNLM
ncbi:Rpn family recombination-promoting nuclease/putative transposase [Aureibacter tunicatorum]|uniref:Transposase/invertase (TIGR01784 family) n=1 Tax=Aureibacter tunicatorum TaxID=866807 RepID=A0AAE3XTC4_9BACT|nr:Rpn family recombination-promoting nuclease/putative transposase [Aureibacter tunicatorum]MDR6241718.1 putative transposase/invertase (TIGR01784 family) [Aureibacter tunicatorum]BDD07297.1 hypothetical protein AUTU_47800 [Aureibacter tunicatorum]